LGIKVMGVDNSYIIHRMGRSLLTRMLNYV
jgi:hypothetical protein